MLTAAAPMALPRVMNSPSLQMILCIFYATFGLYSQKRGRFPFLIFLPGASTPGIYAGKTKITHLVSHSFLKKKLLIDADGLYFLGLS